MYKKTILLAFLAVASLSACHKGGKPAKKNVEDMPISMSQPAKGDKAIYGLACMGCTDSVVVLLPNAGGDPVRYNILEAQRRRQVFGNIEIGDWICILPSRNEKNRASMVIDLDKLKATWTYQVMPHLRDVTHLSKRQQKRILANMPDSIVETYMIPREYGFTLKRMSEVRSVGHVMQTTSVEDDSPVEYPPVPQYTEWHVYNGKLILVKGHMKMGDKESKAPVTRDTMSLVYMDNDSLALRYSNGATLGFHKKADAHSANAAAQAAATKQANKLKQELK